MAELTSPMVMIAAVLLAIFLDVIFAEPRRWHPLVGFGNLVSWCESWANVSSASDQRKKRMGIVCWLLLVAPLPISIVYLQSHWFQWFGPTSWFGTASWFGSVSGGVLVPAICLYFSIGWSSLRQHARAVSNGFEIAGIDAAREQVSRIVSRDTDTMDEAAVARATIESVLENGSDAVFAPVFWFLILGPAGAVAYRLANTLDAMWGYRTERLNQFGWMSAKMDDLLNYIPARLTALTYALFGLRRQALDCWQQQAADCASPNGGPVMCSGAGALNICLGGGAYYHGQWQERVYMGAGREAVMTDVERSVQLVDNTLLFWCVALLLVALTGGVF
ncbi:MAG: adenosylcobinamide-phosphate synthase CbiB [Cellvibrionaceae bacterium]